MKERLKIWLISAQRVNELYHYGKILEVIEATYDVIIELKTITWYTVYEDLVDAFEIGEEPDILEIGYTWLATFYENNLLDPVPDWYVKRPSLATWLEDYAEHNGKSYGLPFFVDPFMIWCNKDLILKYYGKLKEINNFYNFKKICHKIEHTYHKKQKNGNLRAFSLVPRNELGTVYNLLAWAQKDGYKYPELKDHSKNFFNTNQLSAVFEYLIQLMGKNDYNQIDAGVVSSMMDKDFAEGRSVFSMGVGSDIISDTLKNLQKNEKVQHPYGAYAVPPNNPNNSAFSGGGFLCVSNFSQHKELAWKVIDHLFDEVFMERWCLDTGSLPAFEGPFWDHYGHNPIFKVAKQEIIESSHFPIGSMWRSVEYVMMDGILNLFNDYWVLGKPYDEFIVKATIETMNRQIHEILSAD